MAGQDQHHAGIGVSLQSHVVYSAFALLCISLMARNSQAWIWRFALLRKSLMTRNSQVPAEKGMDMDVPESTMPSRPLVASWELCKLHERTFPSRMLPVVELAS